MKTIFDHAARTAIISRINQLTEDHTAQWGKMNVYRMAKHCVIWNNWILGTTPHVYKQELLGKIFGKMGLKSTVGNDKPIKKGVPAGAYLLAKEKEGALEPEKRRWIEQIAAYEHYSNPDFIHDFFGKMTIEDIGILVYKHMDHHLRQFHV